MNLDDLFDLDASNPLVAADPLLLAGSVLAAILIAWLCVYKYADTNDIKKA